MAITFDPAKRATALADPGLDFAHAAQVIEGAVWEFIDDRTDYGEVRVATVGFLRDRMDVVVWTQRGGDCHVISMRKANEREQRRYGVHLD